MLAPASRGVPNAFPSTAPSVLKPHLIATNIWTPCPFPSLPPSFIIPTWMADSGLGALEQEITALHDYAAVRYTNVAFVALILYDYVITIDTEVSRIWSLKWRLPKILYLINRYIVPPMLIFDAIVPAIYNLPESMLVVLVLTDLTAADDQPRCDFIAKWTPWPTIISLTTSEMILMLRVFAVGELAGWIALSSIVTKNTVGSPGGMLFPGCLFSAPTYFYTAWIPPVIFESILIIVTGYYASAYHWTKKGSSQTNLLIARFGRDFLGSLFIAPSSVIACLGASRLMINLGSIAASDTGPTTEDFVMGLSTGTASHDITFETRSRAS
ncbi:unnamed protein product [Mycena citricolor]|uniref:DUF6533 domain-containing protein n=1 Tax=Mycena citricolor TaxID=2018698 RepID=A0AAD2JXB5_9AGAR|nr:unnamed protein product [Mycena citricolor]